MAELDYEKLGFKCGIEIHQELNTKKLFCSCSSALEEKKQTFEIERKLRAVSGETGETDVAAKYETLRERTFVYHGYECEACLVDADCEPPHPINKESLDIALGVAKLLNLRIPDTVCVMRKTVTDGSSSTGFQRTALIGLESENSILPESKVKIFQLNLEEDSCKIEKKEENKVYYSLSRQGVPLLELGTNAEIKNPIHAKEVALEIGTILRSFNVKRGIGTIRQDVNVSIAGGARIEVKGWQDLKTLPLLIENEVMRQYNLIDAKKELEKKGLKNFEKKEIAATKYFINTENKIIGNIIKNKGVVIALLLPKFAGILKKEICTGKTFGRELSEYAKAYGTKGMIHTDEDILKYNLVKEIELIKKEFNAKDEDLIILVAEEKDIAEKAVNAVYERALYFLKGVPEETRIPNHDNATSSYARPLPGAHRMYPETDVPLVNISEEFLAKINVPELLSDKIKRLNKEHNIDESVLKEMIREGINIEDYILRYKKTEPKFIAQFLIEIPKEIKKRYMLDIDSEKYIDEIIGKLEKKEIEKSAVIEILVEKAKGNEVDYNKFKVIDDYHLKSEIKRIVLENKTQNMNAVIGIVMAKLRGKASGQKIVEMTKKEFQNLY